jgi:hypothetical protein
VLTVADVGLAPLQALFAGHGLELIEVPPDAPIPGSYWGEPEAGLAPHRLYLRADTPVHSVLHEACHYLCMDPERRARLDRDAGGDHAEENAVLYLQVRLAEQLPGVGATRLCADMDAWGYTFRLGSAARWYADDADDARIWLEQRGLLVHPVPSAA